MKIESIIKRPGGSIIEMPNPKRVYTFAPESGNHEDPHIADVNEEGHAVAFLRITEGFRLAEGEEAPEVISQAKKLLGDQTLIGSNIHNAKYELTGGTTITLGELVQEAFEDSGLTAEQWNELADQERYEYIDATLLELQSDDPKPEGQEITPPVEQKPVDEPKPAAAELKQEQVTDPKPEAPKAPQTSEPKPLSEMERKELVELYKARFNKNPSTKMQVPDLIHALSESDD